MRRRGPGIRGLEADAFDFPAGCRDPGFSFDPGFIVQPTAQRNLRIG
jgi:hypothetical protein